jgi:PAS domain S-box-containing protein
MTTRPVAHRDRRFQRYLEDVLRVMALPATWAGNNPQTLVSSLLDGALGSVCLEFACLRLNSPFDGIPAKTSRVYGRADPALEQQLNSAVDGWLSVPGEGRRVVPNPVGSGSVTIACLRLGIREARGTLVVGARGASFPRPAESVLLHVAVSQVVIGLDEIRRSVELEHGMAEHAPPERQRLHHPSERDLRFTDLYARLAAQASERKQTQAALRRSESHLSEAQRISHTGSWVWNMTTHEVLWSDEHYRIFGLVPGSLQPTHDLFWATLHSEDRAVIRQRIDTAVAYRRDFDEQFRLAWLDGSIRHVHWVGHPAFNAAGGLVEYVGAIVDVTERKLAEEVARRAEHDLARVGRAMTMGQFTATVTHEISQSFAAVVLSADACLRWLAKAPPNLAEVEALVRRIARDAHRASGLLTGIRSLLTGNKPQKTTLSAGDILPDVVTLIRGKARASGVQVFVSAPKELPTFSADRIQLQQVLVNLALNAIEAMHSVTGRPRRLDIGVAQHGDSELCFNVCDSGPGLDPTQRHRVFDAFFTTKDQGMGMGLAICRSIVQAHGGRLWVDRNAGPGETFQFTLPLLRARA